MTIDEALQLVADGGFPKDWDRRCGLCTNIARHAHCHIPHVERLVGQLAEDWEHFSGDRRFPVPSDIEFSREMLLRGGYSSAANKRYMMDSLTGLYSGKYGEMRRKLAGYLVGRLPK